jgi:hypothetical protein
MAQATKVEVLAGADGVLTDKDRKGSVVGDETAGAFDMDMSLL